jgi:glycosyltransferase involved in cell wall biosynthesis
MTSGVGHQRIESVSLICTVFNEIDTIGPFLKSVISMTVEPLELIIVDGGSTDGTTQSIETFIQDHPDRGIVRLIVAPDCNIKVSAGPIAKGRNIAIRESKCDIIASTDAGCIVHPRWLEEITKPLLEDPSTDVVGGWYLPDAKSFFERCVGLLYVLPTTAVNAKTFIPSSRSIAFRKKAWEAVGGYPELSLAGEDTKFVLDLRNNRFRFAYAPNALVYWRMRSSLRSLLRLVHKYGFGDGFLSILLTSGLKSFVKIAVPLLLIVLTIVQSMWFVVPLVLFWWLMPFHRRLSDAMRVDVIAKLPFLAFLQFVTEFAYCSGYVKGRFTSVHPLTSERQ